MALTHEEIRRIVFSFQKARDATVLESTIDAAIQSAIHEIVREAHLPGTEYDPKAISTVLGTPDYSLDDNVSKVLMVEVDEGTSDGKAELHFKNWEDMKILKHGAQTNAKPTHWGIWKGRLWLDPTPDKAYTITYPSIRTAATLDTIPDQFRDAVTKGALAFFEPGYIGVFEKAKKEVLAYWQRERAEQTSIQNDGDVEAHYAVTEQVNVL